MIRELRLYHNQREPVGRNVQEILAQNVEQPHDASLVEALDHLLQEVRAVLILTNKKFRPTFATRGIFGYK